MLPPVVLFQQGTRRHNPFQTQGSKRDERGDIYRNSWLHGAKVTRTIRCASFVLATSAVVGVHAWAVPRRTHSHFVDHRCRRRRAFAGIGVRRRDGIAAPSLLAFPRSRSSQDAVGSRNRTSYGQMPASHTRNSQNGTTGTIQQQQQQYQRAVTLFVLIAFLLLGFGSPARAATSASTAASPNALALSALPVPLGVSNVLRAASLLVTSTLLGLWGWAGVPRTAKAVIVAWGRSATQLYWFGGILMSQLLIVGNTRPWLVAGWIALTAAVAAQEALTRVEYTYPSLSRHMLIAVSGGAGCTLAATLLLQILGPMDPWFAPRTWIPLSGMVLGNALTGTALAAKTVTQELAIRRDQIELRLTHGATWNEAVQPVLQTAYTTALTPILNFLSAAGIVHIPGLMTGQILAGQAPIQAATYQVVVFSVMVTCVCMSVLLLMRLAVSTLVDQSNDRLRLTALQPIDKRKLKKRQYLPSTLRIVPEFCSAVKRQVVQEISRRKNVLPNGMDRIDTDVKEDSNANVLKSRTPPSHSVSLVRPLEESSSGKSPILSVEKMRIQRTQMDVSFDVRYDDRIALTGRSGVGKSQVLKTLAGLEPVRREALQLFDIPSTNMSMAEWRSHVLLVPQERPSLEGTPSQFYTQVLSFGSRQSPVNGGANVIAGHCMSPSEYCAEWGLSPQRLDQPWSTLSGGESQRALLAIALALQPDVLLLDESTSALDDKTARLVETTLKRLRIPVVMVSHSAAQVDRFCNLQINLEGEQHTAVVSAFQ